MYMWHQYCLWVTIALVTTVNWRVAESTRPFQSTIHTLRGIFNDRVDDLRYRSLQQYQDRIYDMLRLTFLKFNSTQASYADDAKRNLEEYVLQLEKAYNDTVSVLNIQRISLRELEQNSQARPKQFDDSLEQFRKFYDASMHNYVNGSTSKRNFWPSWNFWSESDELHEPFSLQIKKLSEQLNDNWSTVTRSAKDASDAAKLALGQTIFDFNMKQDELISNAQSIVRKSQVAIKTTIDKNDLRRERQDLELKLGQLEEQATTWLESQTQKFELALKTLQENVLTTNSIYDELVIRRKASVQYIQQNDATLRTVLSLIDPSSQGGARFCNRYIKYSKHTTQYKIIESPLQDGS